MENPPNKYNMTKYRKIKPYLSEYSLKLDIKEKEYLLIRNMNKNICFL